MAIFGRSLKTPIFWKSAKGRRRKIFQKLPKKKPWLQRANSTLAQMSLSSNLYQLIVQRPDKILACNAAPNVPEWPSYGNIRKVTQNPHFLKISSLAQVALSSNLYALNEQRMEMVLAQTTAPKVPGWPSYCNFCKATQNPHFLKKCKGGAKGYFLNIAQKDALV